MFWVKVFSLGSKEGCNGEEEALQPDCQDQSWSIWMRHEDVDTFLDQSGHWFSHL